MTKRLLWMILYLTGLSAVASPSLPAEPNKAVFADLLYWHASEETASSWIYIPQLPNITTPNVYFGWSPGLRLGVGYKAPSLDSKLYWTHFSTKASAAARALPGQTLLPEFFNGFTTLTPFNSAQLQWQLTMNMLDLEVGHGFQPLDTLIIRPFFGVKGGSINQDLRSQWNFQGALFNILPIAYSATENVQNNFYGVGPSFGIDSKWQLYKNIRLRGDFASALMWGHWHTPDVYSGPSLSGLQLQTTIASNTNNSLGTLMFRYFAGIDWTFKTKAIVRLKAGYEMQYWINQLRLPLFQQVPVHGDLTLQGGVCAILIRF